MKLINGKQNTMKGIIIGAILGTVLTGSIAVTAVTLTAKEIKYTPSNEKFTVNNAEDALDEIYKLTEYEIPKDTYFYEQGTEGDSETIVRYKKINNEYFTCDQNGKVEEEKNSIDITSKTLVPYESISPNNLAAGTAGYASNSFVLGSNPGSGKYKYFRSRLYIQNMGTWFLFHANIEGSNDGSTWTTIGGISGTPTTGQEKNFYSSAYKN